MSELNNRVALQVVHESVDQDFVKALHQWTINQMTVAASNDSPLKVGQIIASLTYYLCTEIHHNCDSEKQICCITHLYSDYLHDLGHALVREYGVGTSKKSR